VKYIWFLKRKKRKEKNILLYIRHIEETEFVNNLFILKQKQKQEQKQTNKQKTKTKKQKKKQQQQQKKKEK
jgi:hypothetical protein